MVLRSEDNGAVRRLRLRSGLSLPFISGCFPVPSYGHHRGVPDSPPISRVEHRSIFLGLISVGLFSIVGKLAMGLKEVAVAWRFGVCRGVGQAELDP